MCSHAALGKVIVAVTALCIGQAHAEDATPAPPINSQQQAPESKPGQCYTVVAPAQGVDPESTILVNGCTGATWLLVRTPVLDVKGKPTKTFTFTWHPLPIDTDVPVLSYPAVNLPK